MGNVLSVTDAEGNITRYQYNALSKVTRAVNAVSGTTVYEYSKAGDLLSETDPLGYKKTYTYDTYGNRLTETDAMGNTTVYTYDANNNLLTVRKVFIDHCFNEEAAKQLSEMIKSEFADAVIKISTTGGLCSFYAEQGGMLVGIEC